MSGIDLRLRDLEALFPSDFSAEQIARAKTIMLKELALSCHKFYGGKMATMPKKPASSASTGSTFGTRRASR